MSITSNHHPEVVDEVNGLCAQAEAAQENWDQAAVEARQEILSDLDKGELDAASLDWFHRDVMADLVREGTVRGSFRLTSKAAAPDLLPRLAQLHDFLCQQAAAHERDAQRDPSARTAASAQGAAWAYAHAARELQRLTGAGQAPPILERATAQHCVLLRQLSQRDYDAAEVNVAERDRLAEMDRAGWVQVTYSLAAKGRQVLVEAVERARGKRQAA